MSIAVHDVCFSKIGHHRGNPRLWFEGRRLRSIGAIPGTRYDLIVDPAIRTLTIVITEAGDRVVSSRTDTPIIDINNGLIAAALGDTATRIRAVFEAGRITVTVAPNEQAEEERRDRLAWKLANGLPVTSGSLFHGAGILDAAIHQGLADCGVKMEMKFAVELEPRFLDTSIRNNPVWSTDALAIAGSIDEVPPEYLPQVDFLIAGIPCTGASLSGRAKLKTKAVEEHPSAGHLFVPFLQVVRAVQPVVVVIENVVPYRTSPSWLVMRASLDALGYEIHEAVVDAYDLGCLERRERFVAIAVTKGAALRIRFDTLAAPVARPETLAAVMDPIGVEHRWSRCDGLRAKAVRDKAKVEMTRRGTGFQMQILMPDATSVPVVTKDYHKWRSTDPKIGGHPTDPLMLRQLSPTEHAAVKGVPFKLVAGECPTVQHQMLGQSVCFPAFQAVGRVLGAALVACPRRSVSARQPHSGGSDVVRNSGSCRQNQRRASNGQMILAL